MSGLSKFFHVARMIGGDTRFKNIDEKDREELFQDYVDDLLKKETEQKRVEQ
jgi:FF domain